MKHLDEGTIHAWLDGERQHDAEEIERHVAACAECSTRVAEARGLIAGASRILSALDDVGGGIAPTRTGSGHARPTARARTIRVIAWLAAAGLVAVVGVKTLERPGGEPMTAGSTPASMSTRVPGVKPSSPDAKLSAPVVKPSSPDAKSGAPVVKPSSPDAKSGAPVVKPSSVAVTLSAEARGVVNGNVVSQKAEQALPAAAAMAIAQAPVGARRVAGGQAVVARAMDRVDGGLGHVPMCYLSADMMLMLDSTLVRAGVPARMLRDTTGVVGAWERVRGDSVELRWTLGGRVERGVVEPGALRLGATAWAPINCRLMTR